MYLLYIFVYLLFFVYIYVSIIFCMFVYICVSIVFCIYLCIYYFSYVCIFCVNVYIYVSMVSCMFVQRAVGWGPMWQSRRKSVILRVKTQRFFLDIYGSFANVSGGYVLLFFFCFMAWLSRRKFVILRVQYRNFRFCTRLCCGCIGFFCGCRGRVCSVLQCVAVCCSVLLCVAVTGRIWMALLWIRASPPRAENLKICNPVCNNTNLQNYVCKALVQMFMAILRMYMEDII